MKCFNVVFGCAEIIFLTVACNGEKNSAVDSCGLNCSATNAVNSTEKPFNLAPNSKILFTLPNKNLSEVVCGALNGRAAPTACAGVFSASIMRVVAPLVDFNPALNLSALSGFTVVGNGVQKRVRSPFGDSKTFLQAQGGHYSFYLDTRDKDTLSPNIMTHPVAGISYKLVNQQTDAAISWAYPWRYLADNGLHNLEWIMKVKVATASQPYHDPADGSKKAIPYLGSNIVFNYKTNIPVRDEANNNTNCPRVIFVHYGPQIYDPRYVENISNDNSTDMLQPIIKPSIVFDSGISTGAAINFNIFDISHPNRTTSQLIENKYSESLPGSSGMQGTVGNNNPWFKIRISRNKFQTLLNDISLTMPSLLAPSCTNYLASHNNLKAFSLNPNDYFIDYFAINGEIAVSTSLSVATKLGYIGWDVSAMSLRACPVSGCDGNVQ